MAIDMACGKIVNEKSPPAETNYGGKGYYFYADFCKQALDREPAKFFQAAKEWGKPSTGIFTETPGKKRFSIGGYVIWKERALMVSGHWSSSIPCSF